MGFPHSRRARGTGRASAAWPGDRDRPESAELRIPLLCFLEKSAVKVKSACARQSPRQLGGSLPGTAGFVSGAAGRGPLKQRRPPKADALVQFDAAEVERRLSRRYEVLKAMAGYHHRYAG